MILRGVASGCLSRCRLVRFEAWGLGRKGRAGGVGMALGLCGGVGWKARVGGGRGLPFDFNSIGLESRLGHGFWTQSVPF